MIEEKPRLSFWQIWNMSFGFFGIQFGWGLQMGNMSSIYEYLGASEHELPLLWLAAPITGLIVQPIIGHMSDRTWCRFGRRRPYFLVGAIFASIALFFMPQSSTLWMAAGLLWILDASVNISMEPFRAFVADLLPEKQRTVGFAMQSVFIGAGAVIASKLPGWLADSGVSEDTTTQAIPETVHIAFTTGAIVFLVAVLWTVFTAKEHPPENMEEFQKEKEAGGYSEIFTAFRQMPKRMKQLSAVQFFTWMGLFCMWIFFSVAVPRDILGASDTSSALYKEGVNLANDCFASYNLAAFFVALGFLWLGRFVRAKWIHFFSLIAGGLGLASVGWVTDPFILKWVSFTGVGIAWASILSMPYAMLANALPQNRMGVYMGIFNFFIVIPQILVAIVLSRMMQNYEGFSRLNAVVIGGVCILIAAALTLTVNEDESESTVTS